MVTLADIYSRTERPVLTRRERNVLFTVKYDDRVVSWSHKTFMKLAGFGLVSRDPVNENRTRYRVRATKLGMYLDSLPDAERTPVPDEVPDGWEHASSKKINPLRPNMETAHG